MSHADIAVLGTVILAFATLATAHLGIVVGLMRRAPRWRSPVALILAPLAPYWAMKNRMFVRGGIWIATMLAYVVARVLADF
jgi:hypothetical protein